MAPAQTARPPCAPFRRAFTMIEMLVVIAIIGLLVAMLVPALSMARRRARMTTCIGQLREIMHAIVMYRNDFEAQSPPWLSTLYPQYVSTPKIFVCPSDNTRGEEGPKPHWFAEEGDTNLFPETWDNGKSTAPADMTCYRNDLITACSYMYEFGIVQCSWWPATATWADFDKNGFVSWREAKETEIRGLYYEGGEIKTNAKEAYGGHVPMIRCFWHARRSKNLWDEPVLNVACENGNIYESKVEGSSWKRAAQ